MPNLIRSSGSSCSSSAERGFSDFTLMSPWNPIVLRTASLRSISLSSPTNAPPHTKRMFVFPAYLVDFIYIDDAGLRALHITSGVLDQAQNDIFNVFTDIAGFGEGCRIHDSKWNAEQTRQGLRQQGLSGSGRSNE